MSKNKLGVLSYLVILCLYLGGFSQAVYTDASFNFCENSGTLNRDITLNMNAGEEREICMDFYTSSEEPVEITYGFNRGDIDAHQLKVCDNDMSDNNEFSKYLRSENGGPRVFSISAKDGHKIIKEKFKLPLGMTGIFFGCMSYQGKGISKKSGQLLDIVFRKTAKINVMVGGSAAIKSSIQLLKNQGSIFSSNNKIKAELDKNGKLNLGFLVENNGNLDQNVSIKGSIHNAMGFEKEFEIPMQKIAGTSKYEFTTNIGIIPFYKGFFNVEFSVKSEPIFGFDSKNIDTKLKQGTTLEGNGQLFIFSRIWIIAGIIAILIIWMMFRPLFKKHTT